MAKDSPGTASDSHDAGHDSAAEPPLPKRAIWPYLLLVALAVLAGGYAGWRSYSAPNATRVLVAIEVDGQWWQGSRAAAALADKLGQKLEKLGFDPVRAGDPGVVAALEHAASPAAAARKLRAAFVLSGTLTTVVSELPVSPKLFEAGLEGDLEVVDIEADKSLAGGTLHGFATARDRDASLQNAAASLADAVLDEAVPAMLAGQRLAAILGGRDPKLVDKLAPAKLYVTIRNKKKSDVDAAYGKLEADRLSEEKSGARLTFASDARADDRLVATGPEGVLVATAAVDAVYHHDDVDVARQLQLETLEWRSDGGRTLLWRGYNAFTYPSAAAGTALLVEDIYGYARSVTVVAAGKLARVRVEPDLKLSEPHLSPDGAKVALIERECSGCPPSLIVLDLKDANARELFRIDRADWRWFGGFTWLDSARLLVAFMPADAGRYRLDGEQRGSLWAIDLASRRGETLFTAENADDTLSLPPSSDDGKAAAVVRDGSGAAALTIVDVAAKKATTYDVGGRPGGLAFDRGGARVAFECLPRGGRYEEIGVLDRANGKVTRLTNNDSPDRFPLFSADGKRVYFEAKNADPVFGKRRAVSRIAWIPAP